MPTAAVEADGHAAATQLGLLLLRDWAGLSFLWEVRPLVAVLNKGRVSTASVRRLTGALVTGPVMPRDVSAAASLDELGRASIGAWGLGASRVAILG